MLETQLCKNKGWEMTIQLDRFPHLFQLTLIHWEI